jgi:acyl-CoA reductase-like NAD-dependent aldehyde dehydrogenase
MTVQPDPVSVPAPPPAAPRPADSSALAAVEAALAATEGIDELPLPEQHRLLSAAQEALADLLDEGAAADTAEQS